MSILELIKFNGDKKRDPEKYELYLKLLGNFAVNEELIEALEFLLVQFQNKVKWSGEDMAEVACAKKTIRKARGE